MITDIFDKAGIELDYGVPKKINPPFLVYLGAGTSNQVADDKVNYKAYNYRIEYYFKDKNEEFEEKIENIFDTNEIVWEKSEDVYITNEKLFVIYYYI